MDSFFFQIPFFHRFSVRPVSAAERERAMFLSCPKTVFPYSCAYLQASGIKWVRKRWREIDMLIHTVQRGETLQRIADLYGLPVSRLVSANELPDPDRLAVGQSLVIPVPGRRHVVQPGENLWNIAARYGLDPAVLIQNNRIANPALIFPGMVLNIPAKTYRVQAGDTLGQIAQRFGTTVAELTEINQIQDPDRIFPGTLIVIPFPKPVIEVNAFIIRTGEEGAEDVRPFAGALTYASPFAYRIREDGTLREINDGPAIQAMLSGSVAPMMCITNFTAEDPGTRLVHTILSDPRLQDRLLEETVRTMRQKGYRGLNIDFENVEPADRQNYNQFLERAVRTLHPYGYFVSSSLAPKISPDQKGLLYEAHDYSAHGRILDFVILMTYEWGYRLGPPQAISPLNQIRRVLDYAVTAIPRDKILMGFQLYARDWLLPHEEGMEAETFDMQEAVRRAVRYGAEIQFDPVSQTPFFRYRDESGRLHEVWFEDARSAQAKFDTVKNYRLRGISYWVLGYPFPQNWLLLRDNFRIRKIM